MIYSRNAEEIYYGECEHIFVNSNDIRRDECIKRYYYFFDPYYNKVRRIIICNEYLRRLVHEENNKNGGDIHRDGYYTYYNIIERIFSEVGYLKPDNCYNYNNIGNKMDVTYEACERPYIVGRISMREALNILSNGTNDWCVFYDFRRDVINTIKKEAGYLSKYGKYITARKELMILIKKLSCLGLEFSDYKREETELLLTDIFSSYLLIKTKLKLL